MTQIQPAATELEELRRYFQACEHEFGRQHWDAGAILEHFNEDGTLKGDGKWRIKDIYDLLTKWQEAQRCLNAIDFSLCKYLNAEQAKQPA